MKKNMFKSVHKLFAAAACMSMLLAGFVSCGNLTGGGDTQMTKSAEKKITEFKFEKANNPGLEKDVIGTIDELSKTIDVIVPSGTDVTKLKASFSLSKNTRASVKTTVQESGKTENDFTIPVSYTVTAVDASKEVYLVHVEATPVAGKFSGKKILMFGFRKDVNPGLSADVVGTVGTIKKQGFCFIKFPAGTTEATIKSLKPTFTASSKAVLSINGMKLESSKTAVDFYNLTDGTNITVTAEDGSSSIYNVAIEIDLPNASRRAVQNLIGSYYAVANTSAFGKAKIVIVLEENKVTLYSDVMSMDYVNVEWEKKDDGSYTCTTYKTLYNKKDGTIIMKMPQIKNLYGKSGYDFTEKDGKIMVKTFIMGAPVTATKGPDFVWTEKSGYKKVTLHL